VDATDLQARAGELARLVVHQRDQRANDQRRTSARDRRKLVAKRLSRAGGHNQKRVAAIGDGAADGLLIGAEGCESEGAV